MSCRNTNRKLSIGVTVIKLFMIVKENLVITNLTMK